jgi:hypothetical protein
VFLAGEFDAAEADALARDLRPLIDAPPHVVALNLREVTYMCSRGLARSSNCAAPPSGPVRVGDHRRIHDRSAPHRRGRTQRGSRALGDVAVGMTTRTLVDLARAATAAALGACSHDVRRRLTPASA